MTEQYTEFGPVERKRKLYESLLEKLIMMLLGQPNIELGPVIGSFSRRIPLGFSEYIEAQVRSSNIPPYDEVAELFPDLFAEEGEVIPQQLSENTAQEGEATPLLTYAATPSQETRAPVEETPPLLTSQPGEYLPPPNISEGRE